MTSSSGDEWTTSSRVGHSLTGGGHVLQDMKELGLDSSGIPCLYADSFDQKSLEAVCRQTKVIISTVGPFEKYGSLLVECCVKEKTHYCDITGEIHWVKQLIDK